MSRLKRTATLLIIIISMLFTNSFSTLASDINLSLKANTLILNWINKGVIVGYPDGRYQLNQPITRAELAVFICRIFGFSHTDDTLVMSDVPSSKWSAPSIYRVLSKNIMNLDFSRSIPAFYPESYVTYQEALTYLSKAYNLNLEEIAIYQPESPNTLLTRLDFIRLIDQLTQDLIYTPGIYTHNIDGNLIINTPHVVLKNMTISGNLYLAEGISHGSIVLDNVYVKGTVYVNGCGENSLTIKNNTVIESMIVENKISTVRLVTETEQALKRLILLTPTILDGPISLSDFASKQYAVYPSNLTNTVSNNKTSVPTSDTVIIAPPHITKPATDTPISDDTTTPGDPPIDNPIPDDTTTPNDPPTDTPIPDDTTTPNDPPTDNPIPDDTTTPVDPPTDNPIPDTITPSDPTDPLAAPSNICIDFISYPNFIISWDTVPLASSYNFEITNLQDSTDYFSLQTTESIITLDNSNYLPSLDNSYTVSVTALTNDTSATATKALCLPELQLQEASNGLLQIKVSPSSPNSMHVQNLSVGIYQEALIASDYSTPTALYTLTLNSTVGTHLIPKLLENDATYTLKIMNPMLPHEATYPLLHYTATYFSNISYNDVISRLCSVGNSEVNPITLTSIRHLNNLSSFVAQGHVTKNKYFKVLNDLDFANPFLDNSSQNTSNFIPIGIKTNRFSTGVIGSSSTSHKPFEGDFDGGGHTISHLKIHIDSNDNISASTYVYAGLFAVVTGSIRNITLDNSCEISVDHGRQCIAAGIVAFANYAGSSRSISNCYNYASISSSSYAGGIVGHVFLEEKASSSIENCYNYGVVSSKYSASGVVNILNLKEASNVLIKNCYNYGSIKTPNYSGGIVSESQGRGISSISHCSNFGLVTAEKPGNLSTDIASAGIIAYASNDVNISYCLNGGTILNDASSVLPSQSITLYAGGISGRLSSKYSSFLYNYNYGNVSNILSYSSKNNWGGILAVPKASPHISHCYTSACSNLILNTTTHDSTSIISLSCHEFVDSLEQNLQHLPTTITTFIAQHIASNCYKCYEMADLASGNLENILQDTLSNTISEEPEDDSLDIHRGVLQVTFSKILMTT